jgi:hypothetical protein
MKSKYPHLPSEPGDGYTRPEHELKDWRQKERDRSCSNPQFVNQGPTNSGAPFYRCKNCSVQASHHR